MYRLFLCYKIYWALSSVLICSNYYCFEATITISSHVFQNFSQFFVYFLLCLKMMCIFVYIIILLVRRKRKTLFSKITIYSLKIHCSYTDRKGCYYKMGFHRIMCLAFDSLSLPCFWTRGTPNSLPIFSLLSS